MSTPIPPIDLPAPIQVDRDGPLPPLLVVLTLVTGLVDAVSYLKLGHVFVANMTGNVVFLGFAVAGARDFSVAGSLIAIGAFLLGALAGGCLGSAVGRHRGRLLAIALAIKIVLVVAALIIAANSVNFEGDPTRFSMIVLLGSAMGLQNAVARRIGVPDLTTTVLTLTLTGLAADSTLAGGKNPHPVRRLVATGTMFAGAMAGAALIFHSGVVAALAVTVTLLALNAVAAYRISKSTDPWTTGA